MLQFVLATFTKHNLSSVLVNLSFHDFCLANCNFDAGTICSYQNGAGQFNWKVQKGSTPSTDTGPTSDVSGAGS